MLRYDKRTYALRAYPNKTSVDAEIIQDGVAALRMLRARHDVDHDRIFVVGHSLGAMWRRISPSRRGRLRES